MIRPYCANTAAPKFPGAGNFAGNFFLWDPKTSDYAQNAQNRLLRQGTCRESSSFAPKPLKRLGLRAVLQRSRRAIREQAGNIGVHCARTKPKPFPRSTQASCYHFFHVFPHSGCKLVCQPDQEYRPDISVQLSPDETEIALNQFPQNFFNKLFSEAKP